MSIAAAQADCNVLGVNIPGVDCELPAPPPPPPPPPGLQYVCHPAVVLFGNTTCDWE